MLVNLHSELLLKPPKLPLHQPGFSIESEVSTALIVVFGEILPQAHPGVDFC
jgi:hypothetical protein